MAVPISPAHLMHCHVLCVHQKEPLITPYNCPSFTPHAIVHGLPIVWVRMFIIYCKNTSALMAWFYFQLRAAWFKFQPQYQWISLVINPTLGLVDFHYIRKSDSRRICDQCIYWDLNQNYTFYQLAHEYQNELLLVQLAISCLAAVKMITYHENELIVKIFGFPCMSRL